MIKQVTSWNWYQDEAYSSSMNIYNVYARTVYNSRVNSKLTVFPLLSFIFCMFFFHLISSHLIFVCVCFHSPVTGSSSSRSAVFLLRAFCRLSKATFRTLPTQVQSKAQIFRILFFSHSYLQFVCLRFFLSDTLLVFLSPAFRWIYNVCLWTCVSVSFSMLIESLGELHAAQVIITYECRVRM